MPRPQSGLECLKCAVFPRPRQQRALSHLSATPESRKRLPKVSWLCKAIVFESHHRFHKRSENDPRVFALWRSVSHTGVFVRARYPCIHAVGAFGAIGAVFARFFPWFSTTLGVYRCYRCQVNMNEKTAKQSGPGFGHFPVKAI